METQLIKRTCDSATCDTSITIDQKNPDLEVLKSWLTIFRFTVAKGQDGKEGLQGIPSNFCSSRCVVAGLNITELAPPKKEKH